MGQVHAPGQNDMMKKVLFLVPSLGMGGMERVLVNYANLFVSRGYDVTVKNFTYDDDAIVSHFHPAVHYEKEYAPVKNLLHASVKDILHGNFRILPWGKWIKTRSSRYLYHRYVKESYDVEIAFFGSESIKIISGSDNTNAVKIGWVHNVNVDCDIPPLGTLEQAKKVYCDIQNLICVSEQSKEKIKEYFGRTDHVYAVNNPNDTKKIRAMAKEDGAPEKHNFTFVNVSRMDDHQKGYLRLLSVTDRLVREGFDFTLWLIGDGIDYARIKAKAEEYGLSNVCFFGQQQNPYKYISAADMYLCASYFEGFSMVMMEAVILAKPQLSTDVSGAREMLGDSEYGLVAENSEEGLYEGMKKILSDKELFARYVEKAEERKDYLSEDAIMDRVEEIINR